MKPKLSIVIANYNNAHFLKRCVSSIYASNASFPFEVVIIDDCSKDNSLELIDELENTYDNLWSIRKEKNMSVGNTRNRAFYEVNGEYVLNFDADDYFLNDFLENISKLDSSWPDIIVFNYFYEFFDANEKFRYKDLRDFQTNIEWQLLWNKIIKRSLVTDNNIKFYETNMYDDVSGLISIRFKAQSFLHINHSFVHYSYNKSSLIHSTFTDKKVDNMINDTQVLLKKIIIHIVNQNPGNQDVFEYAKKIYAQNVHYTYLVDGIEEIEMYFERKDYMWTPIRSLTFLGIWLLFNSQIVLVIVRIWNKLLKRNVWLERFDKINEKYNDTVEQIVDKVENISNKYEQKRDDFKVKLETTKDDLKDKIETKKDDIKVKIGTTKDDITSKFENMSNKKNEEEDR